MYVPGIKKNLISVPTIANVRLHVHFVDNKCMVHDFSNGDVIVMSGTLCNGLYRSNTTDRSTHRSRGRDQRKRERENAGRAHC